MLNRKPINLNKQWITKPLHKDTFTHAAINSSIGTTDRLYMVTNAIEPKQEFLELKENDKLSIKAKVSIKPGYAKHAREQAGALKYMHGRVIQRPEFSVRLYVYDKPTMLEIFSFKHTTTNEKEVYRLIDMLEKKVINML